LAGRRGRIRRMRRRSGAALLRHLTLQESGADGSGGVGPRRPAQRDARALRRGGPPGPLPSWRPGCALEGGPSNRPSGALRSVADPSDPLGREVRLSSRSPSRPRSRRSAPSAEPPLRAAPWLPPLPRALRSPRPSRPRPRGPATAQPPRSKRDASRRAAARAPAAARARRAPRHALPARGATGPRSADRGPLGHGFVLRARIRTAPALGHAGEARLDVELAQARLGALDLGAPAAHLGA